MQIFETSCTETKATTNKLTRNRFKTGFYLMANPFGAVFPTTTFPLSSSLFLSRPLSSSIFLSLPLLSFRSSCTISNAHTLSLTHTHTHTHTLKLSHSCFFSLFATKPTMGSKNSSNKKARNALKI